MVQKDALFWNQWKHNFTIFNFTDVINLIFCILFWCIFFSFDEFLRILSTKSTISRKLNIGKLFSHRFKGFIPIKDMQTQGPQEVAKVLWQKNCHFWSFILANTKTFFILQKNFKCILHTFFKYKIDYISETKNRKIVFT